MYFAVVSENWGSCVRLKITVKSDNCGDSQDCTGKGVCYTNVSMVCTLYLITEVAIDKFLFLW